MRKLQVSLKLLTLDVSNKNVHIGKANPATASAWGYFINDVCLTSWKEMNT